MHTTDQQQPLAMGWMLCLAVVVGVLGGYTSIGFNLIIGLVHNLLFYGQLSLQFDPTEYMAVSRWGVFIILVPVAGSFIVTWITDTFAPETRGTGVPEVMNAIYYKEGKVRPVVVVAKAITSAISIGSGGSVGRQAPMVQIGSALGSGVGQLVSMPGRQRNILLASGVAAGIAGTFNAPLGGALFAIELMLVTVNARAISLVVAAVVTSTFIVHAYIGSQPVFDLPNLAVFADSLAGSASLLLFFPFGLLMGLAASLFLFAVYWFEDHFVLWLPNTYIRHASGMLIIGIMLYTMMQMTGRYYIGGVGYSVVMDVLRQALSDPKLLLLLFAAKLLATGLTLGSGASGGVFGPSLFLGATLGAAFGQALNATFPEWQLQPAVFAISGMAAMVGGTTGAVISAMLIVFEQTRDYSAILPIMIATVLAHLVREYSTTESIYTLRLAKKGLWVPKGLEAGTISTRLAEHLMCCDVQVVDRSDLKQGQCAALSAAKSQYTLIQEQGKISGMIKGKLADLSSGQHLDELIDTNILFVSRQIPMPALMRMMRTRQSVRAVVMSEASTAEARHVLGVITTAEVFNTVQQDVSLMG